MPMTKEQRSAAAKKAAATRARNKAAGIPPKKKPPAKPKKVGTPKQRNLAARFLAGSLIQERKREGTEEFRRAYRDARESIEHLHRLNPDMASHVFARMLRHQKAREAAFFGDIFVGGRPVKKRKKV